MTFVTTVNIHLILIPSSFVLIICYFTNLLADVYSNTLAYVYICLYACAVVCCRCVLEKKCTVTRARMCWLVGTCERRCVGGSSRCREQSGDWERSHWFTWYGDTVVRKCRYCYAVTSLVWYEKSCVVWSEIVSGEFCGNEFIVVHIVLVIVTIPGADRPLACHVTCISNAMTPMLVAGFKCTVLDGMYRSVFLLFDALTCALSNVENSNVFLFCWSMLYTFIYSGKAHATVLTDLVDWLLYCWALSLVHLTVLSVTFGKSVNVAC